MTYRAIGLMSGTSLDGLDICFAEFTKTSYSYQYKILKAETLPYSAIWEQKLRNAVHLSAEDLLELNADYGFYLGEQVKTFITKHQISNADLIASHGHTVFHQPHRKFTLQIGDGRAIKLINQIPVIYDFRSQDVLMGGNGAPLVPIGDEILFSDYDACLNLGGFANISFKYFGKRIAFDICPVNIVLNELATHLGKKFDIDGAIARNGNVNTMLLSELNALEFYRLESPKSLGSEWVKDHIQPLLKGDTFENVISTFTEHAAFQIARIIESHGMQSVLATGGGTYNKYLIERIQDLSQSEIIIPNPEIVEFKEALIFAFMGVLRLNGENNVLSSATGSREDHSAGLLV